MKPTPAQLRYLRTLAQHTGTTFTPPATRAQASREIQRLKTRRPDGLARLDEHRVQADMAQGRQDAVRHLRSEVSGYGAGARWARNADDASER